MGRIANKILEGLKTFDRPVTPLELSKLIKEDKKSVSKELVRLLRKGALDRPFYGHYCRKPTYEVGTPPRVQNLLFVATSQKNPQLKGKIRVSREFSYEFSDSPDIPELDFRIRLIFGKKRNKIHWTVKAPLGLDLYGLLLARQWADAKCERYGFKDLIWDCNRCEWLRDYQSVTLEGMSIITIDDLSGVLEKYYQKSYGIRREFRISPEGQRFEDIVALTSGGVSTQQVVQGVFQVSQQIEKLTNAFGSFLQNQEGKDRVLKAVSDSQVRIANILDDISKRLKKVEEDKE